MVPGHRCGGKLAQLDGEFQMISRKIFVIFVLAAESSESQLVVAGFVLLAWIVFLIICFGGMDINRMSELLLYSLSQCIILLLLPLPCV